jgi:hypothetical protein
MSRHFVSESASSEFFSHHALVLTYRLLRPTHPEIAQQIQQTLDQIHFAPFETYQGLHTGEVHFNHELIKLLSAHQVGKIVDALTHLGETALNNPNTVQNYMQLLRGLIDDWVQLTEWVLLQDSDTHYARIVH